MDLYNRKRLFETSLRSIRDSTTILPANKEDILRFIDYLRSENLSLARITRIIADLKRLDALFKRPFQEATKDHIRAVVGAIHCLTLSETSKREAKIVLRKFYCFLRGIEEKGNYPPEVKWISMGEECRQRLRGPSPLSRIEQLLEELVQIARNK